MVEVLSPMVKPEFTFLQMEVKCALLQAPEAHEASFGISPETFYPADMAMLRGEFVFTVLDPEVFLIPKVHKAIVTAPAVGMDNAFKVNAATNNPLKGCL